MSLCPVCKTECGEKTRCSCCGFQEVNRFFINRDEAEYWQRNIVIPYRKQYKEMCAAKERIIVESHKNETVIRKQAISNNEYKIILGKYPQSSDGTEYPIAWIVVKELNGKTLLLSEKCLDTLPFDEIKPNYDSPPSTWNKSTLRKWLSTEFFNTAFSEEEKKLIIPYEYEEISTNYRSVSRKFEKNTFRLKDFIFLLSVKEVPLGKNKAQAELTEYAKTKGLKAYNPNKYAHWWLRTTSFSSSAAVVEASGNIYERGYSVDSGFEAKNLWTLGGEKIGVRPAIWVSNRSI